MHPFLGRRIALSGVLLAATLELSGASEYFPEGVQLRELFSPMRVVNLCAAPTLRWRDADMSCSICSHAICRNEDPKDSFASLAAHAAFLIGW